MKSAIAPSEAIVAPLYINGTNLAPERPKPAALAPRYRPRALVAVLAVTPVAPPTPPVTHDKGQTLLNL